MSINVNGQSRATPLPLVAFDLDAVSRVTGLSVAQLLRWDRNRFFQPTYADPNRRRPGSRIYSRNDVVALGMIAELRGLGVPLSQIKRILPLMTSGNDGQWSPPDVYVVRRRVFLSRNEATEAVDAPSRKDAVQIVNEAAITAKVEEAIERLAERLPEEIGQVTRRRAVMRGVPVIAGTRIPTETIVWFHDHGYSLSEIIENFPD